MKGESRAAKVRRLTIMKKRNILRVLCLIFGIITAGALLTQFIIRPKDNADITKAYSYAATREDALPADTDEFIEQDEKMYQRVPFDEETPRISINKSEHRYTEEITLSGLTEKSVPQAKEFEIDGKAYTLNLVDVVYEESKEECLASGTDTYEQVSEPTPADTMTVAYTMQSGEQHETTAPLMELTREDNGNETKTISSTVILPSGTNIFVVNGEKQVAYDSVSPMWNGYQADVIKGANLDKDTRVVSGKWAAEPYIKDGAWQRDIIWTIVQPSVVWTARYETTVTVSGYTAKAKYSATTTELGIDDSLANDSTYDLNAEVTYRFYKSTSTNPIVRLMTSNALLMPGIAVVSGIAFMIAAFTLGFLTFTKKERWTRDSAVDDDAEEQDDK